MKARYKPTGEEGSTDKFNIVSLSEVLFYADDWMDTCHIKDIEVFIDGKWKDLKEAFKDKDVITDNYNTVFGPPPTSEDKERRYWL